MINQLKELDSKSKEIDAEIHSNIESHMPDKLDEEVLVKLRSISNEAITLFEYLIFLDVKSVETLLLIEAAHNIGTSLLNTGDLVTNYNQVFGHKGD